MTWNAFIVSAPISKKGDQIFQKLGKGGGNWYFKKSLGETKGMKKIQKS